MKLSFCIPTYNRCQFLKKNIDIIIRQIHELSVEKEVEILINDNASPDKTEELCLEYIANNPDIHIEFHKNATNEGPDWNFIKAMRLAHGEYSILFGDDDFLIEGSLKTILQLLDNNKDISIFYYNRICIDVNGKTIAEKQFMDITSEYKVFDFSGEDTIRSFFYGVRSLGGILSFISSVVYKSKILEKYPLNDSIIGSNYAFLYYWWSELLEGKQLYFLNKPLVKATTVGATNNNYGKLVNRIMVDYIGISTIINAITRDEFIRNCFYKSIDCDHPFITLQEAYIKDRRNFVQSLEPTLLSAGWLPDDIRWIKCSASPKRAIKLVYYSYIIPFISSIVKVFNKVRN